MRKAALAAALLRLCAPAAIAAPAEPELIPLERSAKPAKAARPLPAAEADVEPKPAPRARPDTARQIKLDRDEIRERIRLGKKRRPWIVARARAWFAKSEHKTRYAIQIPVSQVNPPGDVFVGETQEHDAAGLMTVYGLELAPAQWISVELEYGADTRAGAWRDRFWVHSPGADTLTNVATGGSWNKPDHEDDLVFEADDRMKRQWVSASLYGRVHEGRITTGDEFELSHALDVAAGAHRWRQDGAMTNLRRTFSPGKFYAAGALGPIPGMNSTYRAVWQGPHFGFREEMFAPRGLAFDAVFLISPFMQYRGDGFDNLDAGLRTQSPNFIDSSRGQSLHFRIGGSWAPVDYARLEAGFTRLTFLTRRGTRRYYLAGGGSVDQPLDLVDTEISGFYAGASFRF